MKVEKEYTIKATKARRAVRVRFVCDICGADCTDAVNRNRGTCGLCKRDICNGTLDTKGCMRYDPHESGDYPDKYCKICYYVKYEKHGDRQAQLEEKHWKEEEALDKAVRAESLTIEELLP